MILENEFIVAAPADRVFAELQDIAALGESLPAASLSPLNGDPALQGTLAPRFDGAELTCFATLRSLDVDEDSLSASYALRVRDDEGPALASGTIRARVHGSNGSTRVTVSVDGRLASQSVSEERCKAGGRAPAPRARARASRRTSRRARRAPLRSRGPRPRRRSRSSLPFPLRAATSRRRPRSCPSRPRLPVPVAAGAGAGALALALALLAGRRRGRRGAFVEIRYRW